jgi:hypothetical protein
VTIHETVPMSCLRSVGLIDATLDHFMVLSPVEESRKLIHDLLQLPDVKTLVLVSGA